MLNKYIACTTIFLNKQKNARWVQNKTSVFS